VHFHSCSHLPRALSSAARSLKGMRSKPGIMGPKSPYESGSVDDEIAANVRPQKFSLREGERDEREEQKIRSLPLVQCVAVWYRVVQCVAAFFYVLQCVAVC